MKIQNTLISILIINFNNAKFLTRAINSCLNQSYKNFEILIFDDKSTDKSQLILNEFKKKKKIKVYFNKRKKKKFSALNAMNGYINIFRKSKGSIIFLLDSDDYFHKNKISKILKVFQNNKKVNFVQNLPYLKDKKKIIKKKNKNNPMSFWPYLAPESCISFRKNFMINFLKINKKYTNKFENVWMGFRMGVYSFFQEKSFYTFNENLTYYESLGESKKYKFLGKNWLKRRYDSFDYLNKILKGSISLEKNLDYLLTKFLTTFYK